MSDASAVAEIERDLERIGGELDRELSGWDADPPQTAAYEVAVFGAELEAARIAVRDAAAGGPLDGMLAGVFAREVLREAGRQGRGPRRRPEDPAVTAAIAAQLETTAIASAGGLSDEIRSLAETFRRFAKEVVAPVAEVVHREDRLVPPEVVRGLRELGAFGLSIPIEHGGVHTGDGEGDLAMVVATEELSRASLAAGGGLMTRPEIVAKALLKGGTDAQRARWLPRIAAGDDMVAVAVTEPEVGSDVAGCRMRADPDPEGGYRLFGTKTWCTFAGFANLLLVLARTEPDAGARHRELSLFLVDKPAFTGHAFEHTDARGGRLEGRAIDTLGYRGMHSFELSFDGYHAPADQLVGGDAGRGRGFYVMMEGFAGGRLQTAARAVGLLQAAYDRALAYARQRQLFGRRSIDWPLTQHKLVRMAAGLFAARRATYHVARGASGSADAALAASMVKLFSCREAERGAREAQQIHGGMGYAEEFAVSRYFVDARVLSIFEGAEEVLALKVVAPGLAVRARARTYEERPMDWTIEAPPAAERGAAVAYDAGRIRRPRYGRWLEELAPGRVFAHPRALTVHRGLIDDFARTFMECNPLYLSDPHARALGHPGVPAPPLLVFNAVLSLGVQNDSEQAIANLGYEDVVFLRPVYADDTLTAATRIVDRRARGPGEPGVVTLESWGMNQRGETVVALRRKILVPSGGEAASESAEPGASLPAPGGRAAVVPSLPPGAPDGGASVFFDDFTVGDVIAHRAGRTVTDEHITWSYRTGNTHPLHYDRLWSRTREGAMGGEPVVYGGLVFAWLVGLASRDTTESALWEIGFTAGDHTAPVRTGDTLSAVSRVVGLDPGPPGTGIATFQLVGFRERTAAEAIDAWGADAFARERDKRKAGLTRIAEKVFEVERRVLLRRRAP